MPETEAAAADQAAGSTRARPSTQGSTAAGSTAGTSAGGAVMTAGITKPPPHGRADLGLFIVNYPANLKMFLLCVFFSILSVPNGTESFRKLIN